MPWTNLKDPNPNADTQRRIRDIEGQAPIGYSSVERGGIRIASDQGLLVEGTAVVTGSLIGRRTDEDRSSFLFWDGDATFKWNVLVENQFKSRNSAIFEGKAQFHDTMFVNADIDISHIQQYDSTQNVRVLGLHDNGIVVAIPASQFRSGYGGGGTAIRIVDPLPTDITVTHHDGTVFTLSARQTEVAAGVILGAAAASGGNLLAVQAALMCAQVESVFRVYANSSVPESYNYPHDAVGSDHDSVGIYQQRPSAGWGTVAECMDPEYGARAFIGGTGGPNGGNPPGLFDISPPWDSRSSLGAAVQAVQVSAHPGRYDAVAAAAQTIMDRLIVTSGSGAVIDPLPGHYDSSDPFGGYGNPPFRTYPHTGSDWNGLPSGTNLPAMAGGTVANEQWTDYNGWTVTVDMGGGFFYAYLHMLGRSPKRAGDAVTTGEIIGQLGNTGYNSQGAHLHVTLSDSANAYQGGGNLADPWAFIQANI